MDKSLLHEQCLQAIENGYYSRAIFFANKLTTLEPENPNYLYLLSRCYFLTGQYRRVVFLIESSGIQDVRCRILSARCRAKCEDFKGSLDLISDEDCSLLLSQKNFDLLSDIYLLKGNCCEALDIQSKALEWYQEALRCNLFCFEAWDNLVSHSLIPLDVAEAFLESLPFDKSNEWLKSIYQCKIRKFDKEKMEQENLKLLKKHYNLAENEDVLSSYAESLYYCNQYKEAYEIIKKLIDKDIYCQNGMLVYISCLVELGKKNDLFHIAHELLEESSKSPLGWYAVGCYYYSMGANAQAKRYFTKSTLEGRDFGPSHLALGHTLAVDREHDQCMAAYRTASRLLIGSHIPSLSIGIEYLSVYNDELAEDFIVKAMEMQPQDPYPLNEAGVLYFRRKDYENAAKMFMNVLDIVGENNYDDGWEPTIFNLAHCHRKLGDYNEAIKYYLLSLKILPNTGSTYTALGFTYHLKGDFDMALQCYQQALSITSDDQLASDMLDKAILAKSYSVNLDKLLNS